jgi:hypothetical protein
MTRSLRFILLVPDAIFVVSWFGLILCSVIEGLLDDTGFPSANWLVLGVALVAGVLLLRGLIFRLTYALILINTVYSIITAMFIYVHLFYSHLWQLGYYPFILLLCASGVASLYIVSLESYIVPFRPVMSRSRVLVLNLCTVMLCVGGLLVARPPKWF